MKHAKRMPTDTEVKKAFAKLRQAMGGSAERSYIEWAVERAEEELRRNLPGSTQSFLQALVDDGKELLGEKGTR